MRRVRANDAARRRYVRAYLNADITNALQYDLVINTGSHGFERVARMICAAVVHLVLQDRGQKAQPHLAENSIPGMEQDFLPQDEPVPNGVLLVGS